MDKVYVVTESETDRQILEAVLPEEAKAGAMFVATSGEYAAQSMARSILAVRQQPVALVLSPDTDDAIRVMEEVEFAKESLRMVAGAEFEVVVAVPAVEGLLFQDKAFVEEFAGREFSDAEWELAQALPKRVLPRVLESKGASLDEMLAQLPPRTIEMIRERPPVSELLAFLLRAEVAE